MSAPPRANFAQNNIFFIEKERLNLGSYYNASESEDAYILFKNFLEERRGSTLWYE